MRESSRQPTSAPPIANEVLRKVADCGGVPVEEHEFFFESIRANIAMAWELDAVKNVIGGRRSKALAHSALTLYDTLGNLNGRERAMLDGMLRGMLPIFGKLSGGGFDELHETAYHIAVLSCLVTGKPRPRYPSQLPEPPAPGRRSGTVKNWIFQNLVYDLLISTTEAGGRLTLEKNIRKGSLIEAMKILKPCLRPGLVPSRLPLSTLQRLKDAHSRTSKEVDDLNRG